VGGRESIDSACGRHPRPSLFGAFSGNGRSLRPARSTAEQITSRSSVQIRFQQLNKGNQTPFDPPVKSKANVKIVGLVSFSTSVLLGQSHLPTLGRSLCADTRDKVRSLTCGAFSPLNQKLSATLKSLNREATDIQIAIAARSVKRLF
jgi:hypothetical protein